MNRRIKSRTCGFTLTEVLVALVLLGVLLIALSNLDITRTKLAQTTDSLILVQREATETLGHLQKRVLSAYYIWFDPAQPNTVWIQTINPDNVSVPPKPAEITERTSPTDINWPRFSFHAYRLEGTNLVYYENVIPGTVTALPPPPLLLVVDPKRRTIICRNVTTWSLSSNDPPDLPTQVLLYTGLVMQLTVTDPITTKSFSIGPTEVVSRSMAAARPVAWRPPKPAGTPPI